MNLRRANWHQKSNTYCCPLLFVLFNWEVSGGTWDTKSLCLAILNQRRQLKTFVNVAYRMLTHLGAIVYPTLHMHESRQLV